MKLKPDMTASRDALQPRFRSGAVARMAGMPVATLRVWEQRYRAVSPGTSASGHRLYSAADVQRVLLLRQLTARGHAIGAIAGLDAAQLAQVAQGPGDGLPRAARPASGALRVVVVGLALAARLQRPAVGLRLSRPPQVVAQFESLAEAATAPGGQPVDLLLWQSPSLPTGLPAELAAAQAAWPASRAAVVYRFGSAGARRAVMAEGSLLLREPADDEALGAWLASVQAAVPEPQPGLAPALLQSTIPPRRYDDATLTAMAGLSPSLACECPRHVAELLMQLASFEAYSASCQHRSPADAELHAYLQQVAGESRHLFEAALERVARHEGLTLG
jgi:DNA-binding transcriptional MerR regulator